MRHFNTEEKQTEAFEKCGAFFAFSPKQFNKEAAEGKNYTFIGGGLFTPVGTELSLMEALERINQERVAWELENNSLQDIIFDALANYETQLTGDISGAAEDLSEYGIATETIKEHYSDYYKLCVKNDWF